ncbi:L-seryl-tRNA(Sec) selenium transferase [Shewanella sp. Scap07]|uniref:L-seryl-tRNA(Sec) selenium transferase n=1 Tax=Shewanella sp. Scap07 TaxID=2589987 RepID=UPI0021175EA2|nr:L-seryl-tRNA(Sec) selenium transferase [Shewanella sp. Scap07]
MNNYSREWVRLPQVEQFLQLACIQPYIALLSRPLVTQIVREHFKTVRHDKNRQHSGHQWLEADVCRLLSQRLHVRQSRVINATGTIIHTNLGRSPISSKLWQQVSDVNTHYSNLELALNTGKRGQRKGLVAELLGLLTGADDSLVVNNNACSVYLIILALAQGKEVIVSRGEQIQIGGGFRIPDILAMSGAKLVEVGTTNVTTCDDYINAITENTAMVLLVHQSNFVIRGFTESVDIRQLKAKLPANVILAVDQGSGVSTESFCPQEKAIGRYIQYGADLVCFSGDKILGGPQAGIVCGRNDLIKVLEKNPMMRAFRPGRIILSLLEALLIEKLNQHEAGKGISETLLERLPLTKALAEKLASHLPNKAEVITLTAVVGGGTLPDCDYPCYGVAISGEAKRISEQFRACSVPVIGVISHGRFILNLAGVTEDDFEILLKQFCILFPAQKPEIKWVATK